MEFTRQQRIVLIVMAAAALLLCLVAGWILVRNVQQLRQALAPEEVPVVETAAAVGTTATPTPTSTPTPSPTPTPTPVAPQTRFDLRVARSPNDAALRVERGYAYLELDAYQYALMDFNEAIVLDSTLADAYLGRGLVRFQRKEWDAALADYNAALERNAELIGAHVAKGALLSLRGAHEEALDAFQAAVELAPNDPQVVTRLGDVEWRAGLLERAEVSYTAAISLEPEYVPAYVGRAMVLAEREDVAAAQTDLDTAERIAPLEPMVLNARAWLYAWYLEESFAEAERLAQRALARAEGFLDRAAYLDTLGWTYYQQGRYDEAIQTLEEAVDLVTIEGQVIYRDTLERLQQVRQASGTGGE